MTETGAAEPVVDQPRRWWLPRPSLVWLIPLVALGISLGVGWEAYRSRGPLVEIVFDDASGIKAGETELRFKTLPVGVVEDLDFTDDLLQTIVRVRVTPEAAEFIDENAQFWLVSASVGPRGITGLDTVLSGAYIAVSVDSNKGPMLKQYLALDQPPLTPVGQPGLRIRLRAPDGGSLARGAPILFRQIPVGTLEEVDLTPAGDVISTAFINAPNHERITTATRFWNASGFTVELGAAGAALRVDSLASLFEGGIAFDTISSGGAPVESNHTYELYPNENAARNSLLAGDLSVPVEISAVFDGSVRGLQVGAPVEFRGIRVGEVTAIQAQVVETADGPSVRLNTVFQVLPNRFGISDESEDAEGATLDLLEASVERGLRARLDSSGLLSPTLYVNLVELADMPEAVLLREAGGSPEIPTVPMTETDILTSATGVVDRIQSLPIEEVVQSVVSLLDSANALVNDEGVRAAPENLGLLLADARELIASEELQAAPAELTEILRGIREVVDQAAEAQLVDSLAAAVEDARTAIAAFPAVLKDARGLIGEATSAVEGVPGLIEESQGVAEDLRSLPVEDLVDQATNLVSSVDAFVTSSEVQGVPSEVERTVAEVRLILAELREEGAVDNLSATLASVRRIADEVAAAELAETIQTVAAEARRAAGNVSTASEDLPTLVASLTDLSEQAAQLPLDALATSATEVLDSADAILNAEGTRDIPAELAGALEALRGILDELRGGGAVDSLNNTLASADAAADAITLAAAELPALVQRLSSTAAQADAALASFGPGSQINRDTLLLLQEVRNAARSVDRLVTTLERRPNSIIFGR